MFLTFELKFSNMRLLTLLFILVSFVSFSQKQKPFSGKLIYSIQIQDTALQSLIPIKHMVVFTNDTLLRIENETDQLGIQVIIKHMLLNKSYLLLHTPNTNYAIQTDHSTVKIDSFPYTYKKKCGKKEFCGMKAKRLKVKHSEFPGDMDFYYLKDKSVKYLNSFSNFPGLLVNYYIPSMDGIYEYKLIYIEEMTPPKDMFGIPSDFKKVSFDQFMDEILKMQEEQKEKQE